MNLAQWLNLIVAVALLFQPLGALITSRPVERSRSIEATTPITTVGPNKVDLLVPVEHKIYLPIRYESGEEVAPQSPAPVISQ